MKNPFITFVKLPNLTKTKQLLGFSLIELMVALVIIAILAAIALPSFTEMISNNRILSQAQDMTNGFKLARSEAIKRGTAVSICPSANGTACSGSNSLDAGWIIFIDSATPGVVGNSAHVTTTGGEIITYRNQTGSGTVTVTLPSGINYLRFSSQGFLSN